MQERKTEFLLSLPVVASWFERPKVQLNSFDYLISVMHTRRPRQLAWACLRVSLRYIQAETPRVRHLHVIQMRKCLPGCGSRAASPQGCLAAAVIHLQCFLLLTTSHLSTHKNQQMGSSIKFQDLLKSSARRMSSISGRREAGGGGVEILEGSSCHTRLCSSTASPGDSTRQRRVEGTLLPSAQVHY